MSGENDGRSLPWRESLRFALIAAGITLIPHYALLLEQVRRLSAFGSAALLLWGVAASYIFWCAAVIALAFWAKTLQGSWEKLGLALPTSWRDVFTIGGGCGIFSFGIAYAYVLLMHGAAYLARLSITPDGDRGLLASILLAFWEEFLYRGILYGLAQRFSSRWSAAILSSLIFSLTHPAAAWPIVFISGLIYCHVYNHTRSICGSGLSHSIHNVLVDLLKTP